MMSAPSCPMPPRAIKSHESFLAQLIAAAEQSVAVLPDEPEVVSNVDAEMNKWRRMAKTAAVVTMHECLDKLAILKFKNNVKIEPVWNKPVEYRRFEERLTAEEDDYKLFNYTHLKKMTKDLCFIYNTIEKGVDELAMKDRVTCIDDILNVVESEDKEEEYFLIGHMDSLKYLEHINQELIKIPTRNAKALDKKSDEVYHTQERMEEALGYSLVEFKYVNRFEENRFYMKKLQNEQDEQRYKIVLDDMDTKTRLENRVHLEISTYMDSSRKERQAEIEYWMEHYDSETDRIDQQILDLTLQKEKLETEFDKLKKEYERQKLAIEDWVALRERIRAAEEKTRIAVEAATKIQAWWRGTMVRKHLGPYRRGRKGKKGGKGDKKRGKKK